MTKIDELLNLADSIAASSDQLLKSVSELNYVVSLLLEIHHSIVEADSEIDNYSQLIARNNSYLTEMQKLHEKSFFLEANLQTNDLYTNETSYSNLYKEYSYLWRSFGYDNLDFSVQDEDMPPKDQQRSRLNHMLSILNLNLKPLRCRSVKVAKKKSRYRITEAFNINPLAPNLPSNLPNLPSNVPSHSSNLSSHPSNLPNFPPFVSMTSSGQELRTISEALSRYVLNASSSDVSSLMDESPHRNSITSTHTYGVENSEEIEKMKLQNLNFHPSNLIIQDSLPFDDPSLSISTPLNISSFNLNDVEQLDFDYDSSSPVHSDFDNFHQFLRKSRIDLQNSFPTLKKSVSYELVFSAPLTLKVEAPKKFHNPIDMIYTQKREMVTQPTVEAIYSLPFDAQSNFREHSQKLLAEESKPIVIARNSSRSSSTRAVSNNAIMTPTRKPSVGLFQLMNSPLGSPRGLSDSPLVQRPKLAHKERKGSIDLISKSLATSFMSLVGTSPGASTVSADYLAATPSKSPPEKIKKMRKDLKDPISARNDLVVKRRPPTDRERRNSNQSNTKGTKPQSKKEGKPALLGQINLDLLKEAFRDSLFF